MRGQHIGASMSQYLVDHISAIDNIEVRAGSQVVGVEADGRLRQLVVSSPENRDPVVLPADALFICIGGTPRSEGAIRVGAITDAGGYVLT
ncbi:MAG TPA: hypothetical protein VKF14_19155 [Candidatus Dormibacteraeota bacterium]|nr:hypothetical protein [Candidatus Dormibacteraeota bacterium]